MADAPKGVAEIFDKAGVPPFIWVTIMTLESSGNPRAQDGTGGTGLFQIQQNVGIAGSKYSTNQLLDPLLNSQLTADKMAPLYHKGVSNGLSGLELLRYVAYNGGWPTQRGVNARFKDPVVMRYDIRLVKQYNLTGGQGTAPVVKNAAAGYVGPTTGENTTIAQPAPDAQPVGLLPTLNYFAGKAVYILVLVLLVGVVIYSVQKIFAAGAASSSKAVEA